MKVKDIREMLSCIHEENDEQEVYADGKWIKSITIGSWTRTCLDLPDDEECGCLICKGGPKRHG